MKHPIFVFLICCFLIPEAHAQCVIYADDNTGAFGAGYNNDGVPTTWKECEDLAKKMCREKGGTNCTFLYKSAKSVWWGLINGKKADGRNFFQGGDGYSSKSEAERAVRNKYRQEGGMDANNIKVYTWYSYANVK